MHGRLEGAPRGGRCQAVRLLALRWVSVVALGGSAVVGVVPAGSAAASADPGRDFVPGQVVVRFEDDVSGASRTAARRGVATEGREPLPGPGLELLTLDRGTSVRRAAAELERRSDVKYAEPNFYFEPLARPNDPRFDELWGLDNTGQRVDGRKGVPDADIDAPAAWKVTTGSPDVRVAVVDSGVAYDHPDIAPNLWTNQGETGPGKESNGVDDDGNGYVDDWRGWDFAHDDKAPFDPVGHGTHVAGTIGARGDNGLGVAGVNWRVAIMALKAGDARGPTTATIVAAFRYAADNGARVVNASFGTPRKSRAVGDSIEDNPDVLFVTSAGNTGGNVDRFPGYPCAYDAANLVCVAASTQRDELARFSDFGRRSVDLAAPGENVVSSFPSFRTAFKDDFEASIAGRWTTGGVNDSWERTREGYGSPEHSLADSPGALARNDTASWAQSPLLGLNGSNGCRADWHHVQFSEDGADFLRLQQSSDGASWTTLERFSGFIEPTEISSELEPATGDGYLRLLMTTDDRRRSDGAFVDDLKVKCARSTYSVNDYVDFDGTSMAAPHVAGAAALLWAANPGASVRRVRRALLEGVERKRAFEGKVATGGRLNARRALSELGG